MSEPQYQVTYQPKRTNHILHLLLSLVTAGVWIPVWILVHFQNRDQWEESYTWTATDPGVLPPGPPATVEERDPEAARNTVLFVLAFGVIGGLALVFLSTQGRIAGIGILLLVVGGAVWAYRSGRLD